MIRGRRYYYFRCTYYVDCDDYYEVVDAPEDAIVYDLPEGYEEVVIDGVKYYKYEDVLYKPVYISGELAYRVVYL